MRGLLTKHEVAPLVGSERTMRDWQKKGLIARPQAIDVFGKRLRLYPEIALAQVVLAGRRSAADTAVHAIGQQAMALYETDAFRACVDVLRGQLGDAAGTDIRSVTQLLAEVAADIAAAVEEAVEEIELGLAEEHGVVLSARTGQVEEDADGIVVMTLEGVRRRYDRRHTAGPLHVGDAVRCDTIMIGTLRDEFAIPTIEDTDRSSWRRLALGELAEAVDAVESGGELPSMQYTFLFSAEQDPRTWARQAAGRLRQSVDREQWEDFLGAEIGGYAARHLSLTAVAPSQEPVTADGPTAGGDQWATWQAPDLFA